MGQQVDPYFLNLALFPYLEAQMQSCGIEERLRNPFWHHINPLLVTKYEFCISKMERKREVFFYGITGTYTLMRYSQSWQFFEKQVSISFSVPVRASCPQPQNSATPKKHNPVATRDAKGAPTRHLAQHSNKPGEEEETILNVKQEGNATLTFLPDLCSHAWMKCHPRIQNQESLELQASKM